MTYHHTKAHSKLKIFSRKKHATNLVSFRKILAVWNYNICSRRPVGISADTFPPRLPALGSLYDGLSNCEDRFEKALLDRSGKNYTCRLIWIPFSDNLLWILWMFFNLDRWRNLKVGIYLLLSVFLWNESEFFRFLSCCDFGGWSSFWTGIGFRFRHYEICFKRHSKHTI